MPWSHPSCEPFASGSHDASDMLRRWQCCCHACCTSSPWCPGRRRRRSVDASLPCGAGASAMRGQGGSVIVGMPSASEGLTPLGVFRWTRVIKAEKTPDGRSYVYAADTCNDALIHLRGRRKRVLLLQWFRILA